PIMLRYGYDRKLATGVIAASGTLSQIIPPSLVLIILADQLGRSIGDMYRGAMLPGFILAGAYILYVVICSIVKPSSAPALPEEARIYREPNGKSGLVSLLVLAIAAAAGAWLLDKILLTEKTALDEVVVLNLLLWGIIAFVIAAANKA